MAAKIKAKREIRVKRDVLKVQKVAVYYLLSDFYLVT